MSRIDANMLGYLHTYEAYRIPKGTKVKDAAGEEIILSKNGSGDGIAGRTKKA